MDHLHYTYSEQTVYMIHCLYLLDTTMDHFSYNYSEQPIYIILYLYLLTTALLPNTASFSPSSHPSYFKKKSKHEHTRGGHCATYLDMWYVTKVGMRYEAKPSKMRESNMAETITPPWRWNICFDKVNLLKYIFCAQGPVKK